MPIEKYDYRRQMLILTIKTLYKLQMSIQMLKVQLYDNVLTSVS